MSVDSFGIGGSSVMVDSSNSLLGHKNCASIDSLAHSGDGYFFDDEITLSPIGDKLHDSLDDLINESRRKDKIEKLDNAATEYAKDSLENCKSDVNGNDQCYDDIIAEDFENDCNIRNQSKKKSRIPKSKTFDTTKSAFHTRCFPDYYYQDDPLSSMSTSTSTINTPRTGTGNDGRNHVFITSQECMVVPGCSKIPRETIASRLRYEKQQARDANLSGGEGSQKCFSDGAYHTPSQRKDILIRDLKRQIREFKVVCEEKDREIQMYKQHVDEKTSKLIQAKDAEIEKLREELKQLHKNYEDISNFCEESVSAASILEQRTEDLKHEMDDREKQHQKIYLEMYKKGKDCERIEREEELERLAATGNCSTVTISELVRKLAWTELELAKWQTIRRHESYHEAVHPETESSTTLRFLKDSFFHYITDEKDADHHLRAIIKIFKYTEPQMVKIKESRIVGALEKKNKKKSKRK